MPSPHRTTPRGLARPALIQASFEQLDQLADIYSWFCTLTIPVFVTLIALLAVVDFQSFVDALGEDHWVNWVTFGGWFLAGIAAIIKVNKAKFAPAGARVLVGLLAVFAFYIGLEEINWGQRMTGWRSPSSISERVGHSELSIHYVLSGLTGVPIDLLGGIFLALYGFAIPLLMSSKPTLRRRYSDYLLCLPVPALVPWYLIGGVLMATRVPGLSLAQEIGEMLFGLSFAVWAVCPPPVAARFEPIRKRTVIATLAVIALLAVPLTRETQTERSNKFERELVSELSEVMSNGSENDLVRFLERYEPIPEKIKAVPTAIHIALERRSLEKLQHLAKAGFALEGWNGQGRTPLIAAIESRSLEMVVVLLESGAKPSTKDSRQLSPLHAAVVAKDTLILDAILKHQPEVDSRDGDGFTPLMVAALSNYYQGVDRLLKAKANVYEIDMTGRSVLELAPRESEAEVLLVAAVSKSAVGEEANADPNPARLELTGQPSLVWDTRDRALLSFVSIGLRNGGELQANAVSVELFDGETSLGMLEGSEYVLPGEIEQYSLTGKLKVPDRAKLTIEVSCKTCEPETSAKLQVLPPQ